AQTGILAGGRHRKSGDADESRIPARRIIAVQACRRTLGARKRAGASRVRLRAYGWGPNLPKPLVCKPTVVCVPIIEVIRPDYRFSRSSKDQSEPCERRDETEAAYSAKGVEVF